MLVVEDLLLKEGMSYSAVHFNGSKEELKEAIYRGDMLTFTYAPEGRVKELNVAGHSIMCYETDVDVEEALSFNPNMLDGAQIILFPTAGFGQGALKKQDAAERLLQDLFGQDLSNLHKKPPFGK